MNIVVFGAGAVGGYFGGRLAVSGTPVTFLVRERRYEQLSKNKLNVESIHGNFSVTPQLAVSADEIENPDIVILALKNYHLNAALPTIRRLVEKGAVVLPLLNGVHHMDTLVSEFGEQSVVGGVCYIEATLDGEGNILHTSPMHDVVFGSLTSAHLPLLDELESAFQKSGVNVIHSESIMVDMWRKFMFLTAFSGVTAATRRPIGDVLSDPVSCQFLEDMVKEIVQVAETRNINLPPDTHEQMMRSFKAIPPGMTSSLHRDLEKGMPLEIDSLQGAVLELGRASQVHTPCIQSVYALLHPYKTGI